MPKIRMTVFFVTSILLNIYAQQHIGRRVINEKLITEINTKTWISQYTVSISPDSKRAAYVAVKNEKEFVVIDEKEGKRYNNINCTPVFSFDNKQVAYGAMIEDMKFYRIVDKGKKVEVAAFDLRKAVENTTVFDELDPTIKKVLKNMWGLPAGEDISLFSIYRPKFSADSKRIAFGMTDRAVTELLL